MRRLIPPVCGLPLFALLSPAPVFAQDVPAPCKEVLTTLDKKGDFKDNVLKVNIPRKICT